MPHRRLALRTGFYLLGGALQSLAHLLLLPFLIATLEPGEYSRFGLMISVLTLLPPLLSLNIHLAPSRLYFDHDLGPDRASLLVTTLVSPVALAAAGLAALWLALRLTPGTEPIGRGNGLIHGLVAAAVLGSLIIQYGATVMRIRGRAGMFALTTALDGGVMLGVYLLGEPIIADHFLRSVAAVFAGRVCSAAVAAADARDAIRGGRFSRPLLREAVRFAAPTAVHLLALWAVSQSGRWVGLLFMSLDDLAPYTLVTMITMAMMMVGRALFQARLPEIGSAFGKRDARRGAHLIRQTMWIGLGLVAAAYAAGFAALFAFDLPVPEAYRPTALILGVAAAANAFDVLYLQGIQILSNLKRTATQAGSTLVSAAITVALSFALTGMFGDVGLMAAVAAGLAVQAGASNVLAHRALAGAVTPEPTHGDRPA